MWSIPVDSSLPVPNPTRSFWIDTPGANPLAAEGSDGPFVDDADICIIGSGITGVSAAYHLATAPLRVVILEARDFWRNGGHLTPVVFLDFCAYESKYGTEQAMRSFELENHTTSEIVKLIREEGWTETVDLIQGGHTTIFFTPGELAASKADYEAAKVAGIDLTDVRWLTKEETHLKYGAEYPVVEFGGFNLWPLKFVTQLYRLAKAKGDNFQLNIHTRTPVTSVSPSSSSSRRWAVNTPRGVLNCSYSSTPRMRTPATSFRICLAQRHNPDSWPSNRSAFHYAARETLQMLLGRNEGFEYWFPRPVSGGEKPLVILGGGREVQSPDFEYHQIDDSLVNHSVGESLRKFLPAVFPGIFAEEGKPEQEWTGIMGYTKLKDPFVGPVVDKSEPDGERFKGQYISAGYSGHGMPRAFSCAAVVASMVASDISGTRWEIPRWFPEVFLTSSRPANTASVGV
ncbi:FAD dependent oxidoreductase [Mycena leptocephala]|nr:FAD dependent oxidoreductase [Mycena leptocephala]